MHGRMWLDTPQRQQAITITIVGIVERLLQLALFALFWRSMFEAFTASFNLAYLILLISEGLSLFFVLIRTPTNDVSMIPFDWLLAVAGTCIPLLVRPAHSPPLLPLVLLVFSMSVGLVIQVAAKLTLRRSFGVVPANRGVRIGGPYKIVRHPLYAGYILTQLSFWAANPSPLNALVYLTAFSVQIWRLLAEERLLLRDPVYLEYAERVRYRLLPGLF